MRDKVRRQSIFFLTHSVVLMPPVWMPHVDVYRKGTNCLVKCDLAGIKTEDVAVSAAGCQLTISGIRRDILAEDGWNHYTMEIPYSRFACSVTLPHDLEGAALETNYIDGMLLIRVRFEKNSL